MPTFVLIVLALWLGSLVHLMLSVATLFTRFPKFETTVALEAAPALFRVSERYHLLLALLAVIGTIVWRRLSRVRVVTPLIATILLAALLAILQLLVVTPRMERARLVENRPAFDRLHRVSNVQYVSQTVLVLTAALLLPSAIRRSALPGDALSRDRASAAQPG